MMNAIDNYRRKYENKNTTETTTDNFPETTPCKRNGFRQVNGFLTSEQNDMLEEIAEVTGISKKELVTKMVVDSLESYFEKIAPIVEIRKQYEDAKKSFIFG